MTDALNACGDARRSRALLVSVVMMLLGTPRIDGQEPAVCQTAATAARSARSESLALHATQLGRCPASGPQALAAIWARPGIPVAATEAVRNASGLLRDARLLEAVQAVALDRARSSRERLLALQVLMQYENPSYDPSNALADSGTSLQRRIGGPEPMTGSVALPPDYRRQIGALLARLVNSEPDETVRRAARRLRQVFAYDDPANTPLTAEAITLIAGCGSEVTLRSTADIDVGIELRVAGSPFSRAYDIRAGSASKPTQRRLSIPSGTVVASYGGREVARLENREGSCRPGQVRWPSG